MSGDIIPIPSDAPPYICADLLNVIELEKDTEGRVIEAIEARMDDGEITQGDALRLIDDAPESLRDGLLDFCRNNCSAGYCAMQGFGKELGGITNQDALDALTEEDRSRWEFYVDVDMVRACGKMSMGMDVLL